MEIYLPRSPKKKNKVKKREEWIHAPYLARWSSGESDGRGLPFLSLMVEGNNEKKLTPSSDG